MRQLFFLMAGVCSLITVKAQLPTTATGNTLVNGTTASNASVASTNSAGFKLSIQGAQINWGTGVNTVTSPTHYLRNTTATTGRIWALNSDNTGLFTISDAAGTTTPLTHTNRFLINAAGNMGLGTISNPTAFTSLLNLGSTAANSKLAVWDNATIKTGFGWATGQLRLHLSATTDKFSFLATEAAAADLMTILGTGNVGIGTTAAPAQKLEVNGTIKSTGLIVTTGTPAIGKFLTSTDATGLATWSTTLPVANGGTGLTTALAKGDILYSNAAAVTALSQLAIGTSGQVLTVSATGLPSWAPHTIDGLSNVAITTPANNQVLTYNSTSTKWENKTPAAGGASQWTTSGSNISYTTGSVSIGTATPTAPLTLVGPQSAAFLFNSTDAVGNTCLQVSGLGDIKGRNWLIDAANNRTVFGSTSLPVGSAHAFLNNWTTTANVVTIQGSASQSGDYLRILNNTGSVIANVTATGDMGLGTASPTSKLHILSGGGLNSGLLVESNSSSGYSTIDWKNSSGELAQMLMSGSAFSNGIFNPGSASFNTNAAGGMNLVSFNTGGVIRFATGGLTAVNERMRIDATGNVGIGTTAPEYKLSVEQNANFGIGGISIKNSGSGANTYTAIKFVNNGGEVDRAGIVKNSSNNPAYSGNNSLNIIQNAAYPIGFVTNNTTRMIIDGNGNLGIGTTTPTEKLDVTGNIYTNGKILIGQANTAAVAPYSLAVNGSAIFTKAVVKLNASWPDYVFKPDYQLLSLQELETYLQQHKHLPNIPAAAEVEKNGIDLGNNQTLLLQKIEELTLYIIEQQKQINELKRKVDKR